jgi:hypothetical protein
LSNDPGFSEFPEIAASGTKVYIVWHGEGKNGWGTMFARSINEGSHFRPTRIFTEQDISYFYPKVSASGQHVYLAWLRSTAESAESLSIAFRASHNSGKNFDPIVHLQKKPNIDPGNHTFPFQTTLPPELASNGNHVYVAWNNAWNVYLRASHDNGVTFGPTRTIVAYDFEDFEPGEDQATGLKVASFGNNVYVVWVGLLSGDIYLRASHDGGKSFSRIINLSHSPKGTFPESPEIVADGKNVYVTWMSIGPNGYRAMFAASSDAARSFGEPLFLGSITPNSSVLPKLAADGDNVYVSWGGVREIFFRASHDSGKTFAQLKQLEPRDGFVHFPQVLSAHGKVYVLWILERANFRYDAVVRVSDNHGSSFGPRTIAMSNLDDFWLVTAASHDRIHLGVGGLELTFTHS